MWQRKRYFQYAGNFFTTTLGKLILAMVKS